jgi:hypothetical protein
MHRHRVWRLTRADCELAASGRVNRALAPQGGVVWSQGDTLAPVTGSRVWQAKERYCSGCAQSA